MYLSGVEKLTRTSLKALERGFKRGLFEYTKMGILQAAFPLSGTWLFERENRLKDGPNCLLKEQAFFPCKLDRVSSGRRQGPNANAHKSQPFSSFGGSACCGSCLGASEAAGASGVGAAGSAFCASASALPCAASSTWGRLSEKTFWHEMIAKAIPWSAENLDGGNRALVIGF